MEGYIMDTHGYKGMDDINLKVVKEQAIRLSIQQASRIKLVFLANFKDLDGIQELMRVFVDILGELCHGDITDVPIYFLFNRYPLLKDWVFTFIHSKAKKKTSSLLKEFENNLK